MSLSPLMTFTSALYVIEEILDLSILYFCGNKVANPIFD